MKVTTTATQLFFDRPAVIRAMDAAQRRALAKAGATVRTTAARSIRKRKGVSRPGQPPSSHEGSLRRLMRFGWDPSRRVVVVGPLKFGKGEAPALLERGGVVSRDGERARYRPRPFMAPALEKSTRTLPAAFRGTLKGR